MAWLNVTKSHYKYLSDFGPTYQMRYADYIASQKDNGGAGNSKVDATIATGAEPRLPGGHYIRRAILRDLTAKKDRVVGVLTPTAPLIVQPPPQADSHQLNLNYASTGSSGAFAYQGNYLTETRGRRA